MFLRRLQRRRRWRPTFLIRDDFTDTRAPGAVNGTAATPGPGMRNVGDTPNYLSVGSGVATINSGGVSVNSNVTYFAYGPLARAVGLALIARIKEDVQAGRLSVGFASAANVNSDAGFIIPSSTIPPQRRVNTIENLLASVATGVYAEYAIVCMSAGEMYFVRDGGAGNPWRLIWVTITGTTATLWARIQTIGTGAVNFATDSFRVVTLPAPFSSDFGIATQRLAGSVSAGTTFTHTADAIIGCTAATLSSSGAGVSMRFRKVDNSNFWRIYHNSAGSLFLAEVVAGVEMTRGSALGVLSAGHRIVVIAEGTTIRVFSNNTLRITYSSANNFQTATTGEIDNLGTGGVVSDVVSWPRTITGDAATILDTAAGV